MRVVLMVMALVIAGCAAPAKDSPEPTESAPVTPPVVAVNPEPLLGGNFTWTTEDYDLGDFEVGGPDAQHAEYEYTSRLRGTITIPDGVGPFPLAVFLHGQHTTCAGPDGSEGGDCSRPYRNDRGYLYLMEHLASHGIATASMLAHEINNLNGAGDVGMWARGEAVIATIDALADSKYAQVLDFDRIGLMGHSRGGEGVVTASEVNQLRDTPWPLAGVIALAPTDFAYRNVADIPFLTLAPYCDGDVYSLHGLRQFDQSRYTDVAATKVQLLVMGANHNNYNTMWGKADPGVISNGDDADGLRHLYPECDLSREDGGGRMTLEDTYAEAIFHMGGFLRWTLLDDTSIAPFFLGTAQPAEACPGKVACPGATHLSTMAPGRLDIFWAAESGILGAEGVVTPPATTCRQSSCNNNVYQSAWMADVPLQTATTLNFDLPSMNVSATPVLNVRIGVPTHQSVTPALGPPSMSVTFHSGSTSKNVAINHPALFVPPTLPLDPGFSATGGLGATMGSAKISANAITVHVPAELRHSLDGIDLHFEHDAPTRILLADGWFNPEPAPIPAS